ncbi:MAG: DNA cytosine methyltransferase [Pseudomonadota bacterium]|nr:DNA cytosine methyltransferase [Pseudomonadota bacterium]
MNGGALTYYEFFAGGGMARAGLGEKWRCLLANDIDPMKAATYAANWGADHLVCGDVAKLTPSDLPEAADLAWASFPCQDLSLAGDHAGLGRAAGVGMTRSGSFWPFWALIGKLKVEGRAPRVIALENVYGVLTSRGGKDFAAIGAALGGSGYRFGAFAIDAIHFVPQSRPRVIFVAVAANLSIPAELTETTPSTDWRPKALVGAYGGLSAAAKRKWVWWRLPMPSVRNAALSDLMEERPRDARWHTPDETTRLLGMMSSLNRTKVEAAKQAGRRIVGGVYKRTRPDADGVKRQRAEVRFDGVAGCLRTPAGGSSRQTILVVEGDRVRSRLLSSREAARLMGLPDDYRLPARYNDAYHVAGDGVCPPVVRHIAHHLLEPILAGRAPPMRLMAAE